MVWVVGGWSGWDGWGGSGSGKTAGGKFDNGGDNTIQLRRFAKSVIAGVAQLVERNLAKVEVAGSNPVSRSTKSLYCHLRRSILEPALSP